MKLFEYQAKDLFQEYGIPTPRRHLFENDHELDEAIVQVGLPCVLKAQVLQGGRGKAGLIQIANSVQEVYEKTKEIRQKKNSVKKLLLEQVVDYRSELYLSITIDPESGSALIMACSEGGGEIEDLARTNPEKIIRERVDMRIGLSVFQARDTMFSLGLANEQVTQGTKILERLYNIFCDFDCELVEVNPLMITDRGEVIAADGKITLDDNALFRHRRFELTRDYFDTDRQYQAALEGFPYIEFGGEIAIMCAGAGLTNTVFDMIHDFGGTVGSYLEFGGPNYHKAMKAMKLILDSNPKCLLIVTFGTIARADVMARGIADAIEQLHPTIPIVTCVRGTGEEEAVQVLQSVGLKTEESTERAVEQAISLVKGVFQ